MLLVSLNESTVSLYPQETCLERMLIYFGGTARLGTIPRARLVVPRGLQRASMVL